LAARELCRTGRRVDAGDEMLWQFLDVACSEPIAEHLRDLTGHRDRARHRKCRRHLDGVPDSLLREVLVQQERTLERGGRALERLPENRDEHPAALEVGERV